MRHETIITKLLKSFTDCLEIVVQLGGFMPFRDRQVIHILKESFEQSVHAVKASIDMSMECIEERQHYGKI